MSTEVKPERLAASQAEYGEKRTVSQSRGVEVAGLASPLCPAWADSPDIKLHTSV